MVVDPLWLAVGVIAGGAATAAALQVMGRVRRDALPARTKMTTGWTLRELGAPVIVARDVLDVEVPDGSRVFASGIVDTAVLQRCTVQQVPAVRTEFALQPERRRALLFTAGVRAGTMALLTTDVDIVARLEGEWRTLASRSGEYVERLTISHLAGRAGVTVETLGNVQDVLPWRGRFMLRLEDAGHVIAVVVDKDPSELHDERILVRGALRKDETGYPLIEAQEIRRIR